MSDFSCVYCGAPVPSGVHPNRFNCCGEVGHVERSTPEPDMCPVPCYNCACRGDWCRLRGRRLGASNARGGFG